MTSYGDGLEADAAMTKTLGVTMDKLQSGFDKAVDERFGKLRAALKSSPDLKRSWMAASKRSAPPLRRIPVVSHCNWRTAVLLLRRRTVGRSSRWRKRRRWCRSQSARRAPICLMARLAEQLGDEPRALSEYEKLLAHDHTAVEPARRLAALGGETRQADAAATGYERVVALDPYDAAAHTGLGRLALKRNQPEIAVREFKAAMALQPADRAAAHCDLGEAFLAVGRAPDAKREALAALELAPTYERAQELLLKAIQSKSVGAPGMDAVRPMRIPLAAAGGLLLWLAASVLVPPADAQVVGAPDSRFAGLQWTFARIRYTGVDHVRPAASPTPKTSRGSSMPRRPNRICRAGFAR